MTERLDNLVRANEVRKAISESCNGRGGYVYAMDSKLQWHRIIMVKTHREMVYGYKLNSGKWFVIHQWETK